MGKTIIGWATRTANVVTGCSKPAAVPRAGLQLLAEEDENTGAITRVASKWTRSGTSPECVRCYAEGLSLRRGWSAKPWTEANASQNVILHPDRLKEFRRAKVKPESLPPSKRERFFVCSMGDIFHREVPDAFLHETWDWMLRFPHIYMLLTKRPDRAAKWPGPWPANIWLGTTCGHPMTKWRLGYLRRSRAQTRFLSMEPLLASMLPINLTGIHQVIVGGESGSGWRPMKMEWAREVRDTAGDQGVAFFYKQDAAYRTETRPYLVEEDGRCVQYRQFPGEFTPPRQVHARTKELLTILG